MSKTVNIPSYIGNGITTNTYNDISVSSASNNGAFITWHQPTYSDMIVCSDVNSNSATLEVKGTIKMKNGDILDERLARIETLLEIPTRDLEMEREFPKLRELWNSYTEELEKYKTWKRLKDSK